ncbi:MAG: type I methionyl aminopeptidase [Syntrophomonadaceae bacterium]|nr:type I methionyl aminopeptidase [Syntrophomonadaceae bacterium]MDD3270627.1 type I methionyl aminopeptidase [Syntrophomonadaceae bacterium]MDD3897797.1 type I methionyl aminopeptidase [Syntrophomonadaceae bacterium]MDD4561721.1 type I methionyl aminopeptidase [Syntrophomonadaceae bacterium]
MIMIKTPEEIAKMRVAGQAVAEILELLRTAISPGISTLALNAIAEEECKKRSAIPVFKNYPHSREGGKPFPAAICTSINEEVVHGIPGERSLQEGDIISIDFGLILNGYAGDAAITVPVGEVSKEALRLIKYTEKALFKGIHEARIGNKLGQVSHAIQKYAEEHGFSVVREFVGHGIGRKMHEAPLVPNYGRVNQGPYLKEGMTIAIEPMLNLGARNVFTKADDWTVVTKDGKLSAHFEHSIAITARGPEIFTLS